MPAMASLSTDFLLPATPSSASMKAPAPPAAPPLLPLHRDLLDLPALSAERESAAASISPLDGHFVAHPLHLDLYNPLQHSITTPKTQHIDSNGHSSHRSVVDPTADSSTRTSRFYRLNNHQKQSSTASLAEFLKTTGPEDIRKGPFAGMVRPVSPTSNKKKNPGSFLLKFAVGKNNSTSPKRDDGGEIAMTQGKSGEFPPPPLAKEQFTAAGRKYYAIKVDYPFDDNSSLSARPLLSSSQLDPNADTRSEMDYHAIMAMKKHHRLSSVLASDTSMEFLVDDNNTVTPRSSGRYSSYPPSRSRYSLVRSNSLSEIASESIRDDGSILPGDSVSLRPVQRKRMNTAPSSVQSSSVPLRHPSRNGLSVAAVRSRSPSTSFSTTIQESNVARTLASSPIPPPSAASNTMELMESLDMLDKLRKSRASSDGDSMVSHATTKSLQQRRRAKRLAQGLGSLDVTKRETPKRTIHSSRSIPSDLNNKGLPMLPPHVNSTTTSTVQRERAAAVAAALSPRQKKKSSPEREPGSPTSRRVLSPTFSNVSLENYAIPEDDVLSLRSGISAYRNQRREKVRDKRQKDLEDERSRKLDEAMRLLQKDVQRKREILDKEEQQSQSRRGSSTVATSGGSQTPRQMPSLERLRTPPSTPPLRNPGYSVSPILVVADCPPNAPRRRPSNAPKPTTTTTQDADYRPQTSNSQRTIFTNGPITPVSSAPSSPTKLQYHSLAKQPIPQLVSLPPNYPPPQPSPLQRAKQPLDDREQRIAALEEQKWVLEQALRVLLNQTAAAESSTSSSPHMGYVAGSPGQ